MAAFALAILPLFGIVCLFLGMVLSTSAAVRAGDGVVWWPDAMAGALAFCLGAAALLPA